MQIMERIRESEFLGQEFLVWLWFKSETDRGRFDLGETGVAEIWFDRRVVLQSDGDEGVEKVACSGDNPHLKEARFALTEQKQIKEAMVRLVMDDNEWSFILDSTWMNFRSFKTPKVVVDKGEDPEGLFYEKMYLVERVVAAVDAVYAQFIKVRISPEWETLELPALQGWIRAGKQESITEA